jgi:beta-carotene ketolase (CrtW type)
MADETKVREKPGAATQTAVSLALATGLFAAWLLLHVYGVFLHEFSWWSLLAGSLMVAAMCWLNVGLFILAHDCMHGSLAPGRPRLNAAIGRLSLFLYAGFSFDRLRPKHFDHHRHAGTADDPDFHADNPRHFWRWYMAFFTEYFGLRELAVLSAAVFFYLVVLGAPLANTLLFWALPAILSSLQLFLFGTYLPHREDEQPFTDRHRARSNDYGWAMSLLTCFHFGYHHEHHRAPGTPWWRLPDERRESRRLFGTDSERAGREEGLLGS